MSRLTGAQRVQFVKTLYTFLEGQANETEFAELVQAAIDRCEDACENALHSPQKIDCLVRSFVENAAGSRIDPLVCALVLSRLKAVFERLRVPRAARLNRFIARASEAVLKDVSKKRTRAIALIQETKRQLDAMKLNSIKFTTKLGRGWIDVGGARMFLLDIGGGWHNLAERIMLFAGNDTSRRVLFEAGQSETFTTRALNSGVLKQTPRGFLDALDTLSEAGIGNFSVEELRFDEGYARITCADTFEGWAYLEKGEVSDECVCHYCSGVLVSFMQHTAAKYDLIATETRCIARGDDECEFIVGQRRELELKGISVPEWGMTIKERAEALENLLAEKEKAEKQIRGKNAELAALNEISTAVSQSLELKKIMGLAIKELRKMVGDKAVIIYLLDGTRQALTIAAQEGLSEESVKELSRLNLGEGLTGNVANLGRASAYDDYSSYPQPIKAAIEKEKLHSLLAVPLMAKKQVVGVLTVASRAPYHFTPEEISLLTRIGNHIGVAADNALLHKDLKKSERKYKNLVENQKKALNELKRSRGELRNLSVHLQSVREVETTRVARKIHDELGQLLTGLQMDLAWLEDKLPVDSKRIREKTRNMSGLLESALESVHGITAELRPSMLDDLGLPSTIEWQTSLFQKRTGIRCKVIIRGCADIQKELATSIFRIFQETLTNIMRHSNATKCRITLSENEEELFLEVIDNGIGVTQWQIDNPKSFGMIGMRERAHLWGGAVHVQKAKPSGTTVRVVIPLSGGGK